MKNFSIIIALILLVVLAGCRQQATPTPDNQVELSIEVTLEPAEPVVGEAALLVTVSDAAGNPVSDARLDIRGDMTHAGMTPVLRDIQGGENGVYSIPFEWTMAGDWILEITVTLSSGGTASERFDFTVTSN